MNLKRQIENLPQAVKKIYRKNIISLYTTSPEITLFTPMFHEMKTSLYKTQNDSYPFAPKKINDVKLEGIWQRIDYFSSLSIDFFSNIYYMYINCSLIFLYIYPN